MDNFAYNSDIGDSKDKISARNNSIVSKVGVIGSGDYGRAISARLVKCGVPVVIGSREPQRPHIQKLVHETGAELTTQHDVCVSCDVLIVAVPRTYYDSLPLQLLNGKTLIDVSNNAKRKKGSRYRSNAEYLQAIAPSSHVVKGFNVLSAYALENGGLQGSKEVYIAGDDPTSKSIAVDLCRRLGFTPVDWGSLQAAGDIEDVPLKLMPSWKRPVGVVLGLFIALWLMKLLQSPICDNWQSGNWTQGWKHLGMQNFNRTIAILALWVLSFCYLPGLLAAYLQLWRGTKYSRFPVALDQWLRMRKQLGLLMLGLASLHGCISLGILTPRSVSWVYEPPTKISVGVFNPDGSVETKEITIYDYSLNWRGEIFLTLAGIAMCLTVVLGISSLPSVTSSLSWREFQFIQSKLGWVLLIVSSFHDIFLAWNYMFEYWGCFNTLPIGPQYALYPPLICVVLKLPLLLPAVDKYLTKIRNGHERKTPEDGVKINVIGA